MSIPTGVSSADLRRLLAEAEAAEAVDAEATPHSVLLADLRDHRVQPGQIADAFVRIFDALDLLGVDLLADGGPALKSKAKAARGSAKVTTPDTGDDTSKVGGES